MFGEIAPKNCLAKVRQNYLQKCAKNVCKSTPKKFTKMCLNVCKSVPKMLSKSAPKMYQKVCQNVGKSDQKC